MWRQVQWQKRTKFNATRAEYGGRVYHSMKEANYAAELDLLKRAKEIRDWEPQVRFDLVVNGLKICTIIPDFRVILADGTEEIHEVKSYGTMTEIWRLKRKLFEALYPDVIYKVII